MMHRLNSPHQSMNEVGPFVYVNTGKKLMCNDFVLSICGVKGGGECVLEISQWMNQIVRHGD